MAVTLHPPGGGGEGEPPAPTQSPSQRVVAAANETKRVTDAQGRVIAWRRLDALEEFDLLEITGGANDQWRLTALVASLVREIDGRALAVPQNKAQLRIRVKLLGADGLNAMFAAIQAEAPTPAAEDDDDGQPAQAAPAPDLERAKN